jgi:hypothetical protein
MSGSKRALVTTSLLYLFSASTGARVSIDEDLPMAFLGKTSPNMPQEDFVRGLGTALSPGVKMLVGQVALTALAARRGPLGKLGARGLALYGVITAIGMLGERITFVALHPRTFDPPKAIIIAGNVVLSLLLVAFGLAAAKRDA